MSKTRSSPVAVEYDARLSVVVPTPLHDAITTAAHASLQSVNSFVRGAVLERLRGKASRRRPTDPAARLAAWLRKAA
jgi:predicted HicB family RNase H-like nuclease